MAKFVQVLEFLISNFNIPQPEGDWNANLERIDKKGRFPWRLTSYQNKTILMMAKLNLVDIFQKMKPHVKSYSYESKSL